MAQQEYFVDYYAIFDLDRSMDEKSIKRALGQRQAEVSKLMGSTDRDRTDTLRELQNMMETIRMAIRTLSKPESRRAYDAQLAAAAAAGKVSQEATKEAQDILERARQFFEKGQYQLAIKFARQAVDEQHINREEPFEIISRSQFMLGDYDEAIESAGKAARTFSSSLHLRWLHIRFLAMIEDFNEAQAQLNEAIDSFGADSLLMAEQVYIYAYAGNMPAAHRAIDQYVAANPNDQDYRRYTAQNLIDVSQTCYLMDSAAEIMVLTEEDDYRRCLDLVTTANSLYQDETTMSELNYVRQFGEIVDDEEHRGLRRFYHIGGLILGVIGIVRMTSGSKFAWILLLIGIAMQGLGLLVKRVGRRPYWKVFRDEYRGFKQSEDSFLFNILLAPQDMIKEMLATFFH